MVNDIENQQVQPDDTRLVRNVIIFSWLLMAVLSAGTWFLYDKVFGLSFLLGALLANISFLLLKKDIERLLNAVAGAGNQAHAVSRGEMVRFFVKFYARLIIFGLLLIALITRIELNMIAFSLGLATVIFSIIAVVLGRKSAFSKQRLRSA